MRLWYIITLILILGPISGSGQELNAEQIRFLNKEIRFLNESINRMVIVFGVYEKYNSEITKHVDLPAEDVIINTSRHLPSNLFADNNLVVRGDSPIGLYKELESDPARENFPINNWSLIKEAKSIIDFLNQGRHKTDAIVELEDMDLFANVQTIFKSVEEAKDKYDELRSTVRMFEKLHQNVYHNLVLSPKKKQVYTALTELHYDVKKIVRQIRDDNQSGVINGIRKLEKEIGWVRACIKQLGIPQQESDLRSVATSIEKFIEEVNNYINGKPIPEEYMPYGRGYYYHNRELLHKINQFGSGYVWQLDQFYSKYGWPAVNFVEEPHYIKLVYPELLPIEMMQGDDIPPDQNIRELEPPDLPTLDNLVVQKANDNLTVQKGSEDLPVVEKEKPVEIAYTVVQSENVSVDSTFVTIELFDHLRKDGDRVSISVNGEWVHKKISLEVEKTVIKLQIKPSGTNTVIIRADNEGWMPPNTFGLRYQGKNDTDMIFVKKDLYTSQAIELKFTM